MQRISYILFIFLLIFCPLAFGTVETWSLTILEICSAVSFLLLGTSLLRNKSDGLKVPGIIPLFLLLGFISLQLVPIPVSWMKLLSPATFEMYRPLLDLDPGHNFIPLSLNRKNTLLQLFTFSSYALIYLLTIYHCNKAEYLKRTVTVVIILGIIIAIEAILQKLMSPDAIYWFRSTPNSSPVGPWVYSNHFAGFMEMLFALTVAMFLFHRPQISYTKRFREKIISALTMPGSNQYLLLGTGAILMAVSIFFSISRGGIITLSFAFLFFTLFSARATEDTRVRWSILLASLVVIMITWLGWQPIVDKFGNIWGETGIDTSGRLPVLLDSVNLFRAFPLFGSGFGTFIDLYPSVRTLSGEAVFDHAHNDYIELLATGGLVGFIICGWFVLAVLTHSGKMLYKRRDRYAILLTSGALTGILALLFHSQVDFQIYNGANGLYFFFLCGLAVSGVNTRLQYRTRPSLLDKRNITILLWPIALSLLLLIFSPWYKLNAYRAEQISAPLQYVFMNKHIPQEKLTDMHTSIAESGRLDPLEAEYPYRLGQISTFLNNRARAQKEYLRACMIQPTSGQYIQQLGVAINADHTAINRNLLEVGIQRSPLSLPLYLTYSNWLLQNNQRKESFEVLNTALEKIPWKTTEVINFILPLRFSSKEIEQMLTDTLPMAWYEVGRKMEQLHQPGRAELFYLRSIEIAGEKMANPASYERLHWLYKKQKDEENAWEILRLGIMHLPDHAPFRIRMGDYYLKQGILYRAVEEYEQALRQDPGNIYIRRKLEAIKQN